MNKFLWPLIGFAVLAAFLAIGLTLDPREVPSPLIGKPAPAFDLPQLASPEARFGPRQMQGKVWLLNIWASWCVSCREEHPLLMALEKSGVVPLVGFDYKDTREDALQWIKERGDPYQLIVADVDGRVGIDYGSYGVPETFVIDKAGVIRHKHIGPITEQVLKNKILPLVRELQK